MYATKMSLSSLDNVCGSPAAGKAKMLQELLMLIDGRHLSKSRHL
jgi:hypothetical protein